VRVVMVGNPVFAESERGVGCGACSRRDASRLNEIETAFAENARWLLFSAFGVIKCKFVRVSAGIAGNLLLDSASPRVSRPKLGDPETCGPLGGSLCSISQDLAMMASARNVPQHGPHAVSTIRIATIRA
jgi:hypothetical protein